MLKIYSTLLALLIILMVNAPAAAQQDVPGGKWWQMPTVVERLELSDEEVRRLDETYKESRKRMIRLRADLETEQLELESIIEDLNLDNAAALAQYDKLDKARSELGYERFRFFLDVRTIVGQERFNMLMRLREMRQNSSE